MSEYIMQIDHDIAKGSYTQKRREEIVRCRDCKHRFGCLHLVENEKGDMVRCDSTPDCFCSWGERKG